MGSQRAGHHWATFTFTPPGSPYSALSNHLIPSFQQEFSLSGGHKKLATNPRKVSAVPGLWGGQPATLAVPTLSLLFILSKLTPFWNALCLEILFQPEFRLRQQRNISVSHSFIWQIFIDIPPYAKHLTGSGTKRLCPFCSPLYSQYMV